MGRLKVRQGYELLDARGLRAAGPGEIIADDHPAVLAHPAIETITSRVPDEPAVTAPVDAPAVEEKPAQRRGGVFRGRFPQEDATG